MRRYGAELPPFISIVQYPGRPVILGTKKTPVLKAVWGISWEKRGTDPISILCPLPKNFSIVLFEELFWECQRSRSSTFQSPLPFGVAAQAVFWSLKRASKAHLKGSRRGPKNALFAIGAACYRTEKARIPQKCRAKCREQCREEGNCWGGLLGAVLFLCFSKESGLPALLPAVPPSGPLLPGTVPGTLPGTFGGFGLSQSCSRRPRLQLLIPKRSFAWSSWFDLFMGIQILSLCWVGTASGPFLENNFHPP